jgi:hypothetical protein
MTMMGIGAASNILGKAAAPAQPGMAIGYGGASGGSLDFSGWTVSTGGNGGTSSAVGAPHPVTNTSTPGGFDIGTLALYGLIAVVVIRVMGK